MSAPKRRRGGQASPEEGQQAKVLPPLTACTRPGVVSPREGEGSAERVVWSQDQRGKSWTAQPAPRRARHLCDQCCLWRGEPCPSKDHSSPTSYQVGELLRATPGLRHRHRVHPALRGHSILEEAGLGPEVTQAHQLTVLAPTTLRSSGQLCTGLGWWMASPQTRETGDCAGPPWSPRVSGTRPGAHRPPDETRSSRGADQDEQQPGPHLGPQRVGEGLSCELSGTWVGTRRQGKS